MKTQRPRVPYLQTVSALLFCLLLCTVLFSCASADGPAGLPVNLSAATGLPAPPATQPGSSQVSLPRPLSESIAPGSFPPIEMPEPVSFREIWGYVLSGEEGALDPLWPVTDVGLFGAGLSSTGKLKGVPSRSKLSGYPGRVHLVLAEVSNAALIHFCLDPAFPVRGRLLASLAEAAKGFDGVQIDFEAVLDEDTENFASFLVSLKKRIGNRTLSVAIPARTRKVVEAYEYGRMAQVADRIIVMAYDEHWSGSGPGSVAGAAWCGRVASYALGKIGPKKLVMGLPFYGRAWGDVNPSKAYRFSTLSKLMQTKEISGISRIDGSPSFEYRETVNVRVFYEDSRSVLERARLYSSGGVVKIAFWRIGQEDTAIWNFLKNDSAL